VQDALDEAEGITVPGAPDQHLQAPGSVREGGPNLATIEPSPMAAAPLSAPVKLDPLMRAAVELMADTASLFEQRDGAAQTMPSQAGVGTMTLPLRNAE